ncbi:AraC family transcriptional regulator [Bifidobacterium choloepi]|uniref:AraC family transcriptional regulator n=1 Tax=Bifidobacterium choloepi TaxID=2614131 RepID=UPI002F2B74CF
MSNDDVLVNAPSNVSPKNPLTVFSDRSERPHYNVPGLALYARRDRLSRYGYHMACHWHRDLEFIHVVGGRTSVFVNGEVRVLGAGEGIVINSRRLHYLFSDDGEEAQFVSAVIDPALFGAMHPQLERAMREHDGDDRADFVLLTADDEEDRRLLFGIDEFEATLAGARRGAGANAGTNAGGAGGVGDAGGADDVGGVDDASGAAGATDASGDAEASLDLLRAVSQAARLCLLGLERMEKRPEADGSGAGSGGADGATIGQAAAVDAEVRGRSRESFLNMVAFVREHVAGRLSLDAIARAGAVGRSECCELFRTHAGRTPNDYVTDYRIARGRRLLGDSAMSIGEIARECGFASPSYFSYVFRRRMGCTPRDYRARERAGDDGARE